MVPLPSLENIAKPLLHDIHRKKDSEQILAEGHGRRLPAAIRPVDIVDQLQIGQVSVVSEEPRREAGNRAGR